MGRRAANLCGPAGLDRWPERRQGLVL